MRPLLAAVLLLASCASPPAIQGAAVCPGIETYSPADNAAIAAELAALKQDDVLVKIANEDHRLRAELQACQPQR